MQNIDPEDITAEMICATIDKEFEKGLLMFK
jgi:hypothetical protein